MLKVFLILFLCVPIISYSQKNIILNGNFERTERIPCEINLKPISIYIWDWDSPKESHKGINSPDILSLKTLHYCNKNWFEPELKKYKPKSGDVMIGICVLPQEYFGSKVIDPLKKNNWYYIEYWLLISEKSNCMIDNIGLLLSKKKLYNIKGFNFKSQILRLDSIKKEIGTWQKVSSLFQADDDYQYIMIGNFKQEDKEDIIWIKERTDYPLAYYYIDDVLLREASDSEINKVAQYNTFVLPNVLFKTSEYTLMENSLPILDSVAIVLKDKKIIKVEISAHTDNTGSEIENQKLSEKRAEEVLNYLMGKGVDKSKLISKGYGSLRPITTNHNGKGRTQNRRVEFKVFKIQ